MRFQTLQKPWQFRQVYRDGKKIDCKYAVLFYYRSGEPVDNPQFGFVASKRLGNAVARNRAKRLLREAVRGTESRVKHRDAWIVLVARSGIITIGSRELQAAIDKALEAEGLLEPPAQLS